MIDLLQTSSFVQAYVLVFEAMLVLSCQACEKKFSQSLFRRIASIYLRCSNLRVPIPFMWLYKTQIAMKTRTLFFALLITVSTAALAYGNEGPAMTVVSVKGSEIYKVIYRGSGEGKIRLSILDEQGQKIHSESFAGMAGFILPVNFKGLEAGNYTIEIVDNAGRYEEKIAHLPAGDSKKIHVSKLMRENGKYLLAVRDANNEAINVKIYDEEQRMVYEETKTLSGDFAQVYRIENPRGRYTFEISDAQGKKKHFTF